MFLYYEKFLLFYKLYFNEFFRGQTYRPAAGWWVFGLQVVAAGSLLAVFLLWSSQALPWVAMQQQYLMRIGAFALVLIASFAIYFGACWAAGLNIKALLKR